MDRWQDITYVKFICEYKPNKEEKERTRLAVGGDRVNYPDEVGTPTANLLLIKTHLNSVILMPAARYMTIDISNFYLNTPMERFEYTRIPIADIPEEIISEYDLAKLLDRNNCVCIEIQKGMYGLPQTGILAQELLGQRMARHGYNQSKIVPRLWMHNTCQTTFTLVVDDFGVKYMSIVDAQHLIDALQEDYQITIDWTGAKYIGITLDWDYVCRKVHLTMPKYIAKALESFQHPKPKQPQNSPHPCAITIYGAKMQYAEQVDDTPPLDKEGKNTCNQ